MLHTETSSSSSVSWLVRLRWFALAGQMLGVWFVYPSLGMPVRIALAGLAIVGAVSNIYLARVGSAASLDRSDERRMIGLSLSLDAVVLTGVLALTGGTTNPFTVAYLVYIVLSAVVLNAAWTSAVTIQCIVGFATLFFWPTAPCCTPESRVAYASHMEGMWIAFAVTSLLVGYFVRRISLTLEQQQSRIADLNQEAAQSAHMASLTTLAAGAAHELRTPLATIAVVAHEIRIAAERDGAISRLQDAELVQQQVERCQTILNGMSSQVTGGARDLELVQLQPLVSAIVQEYATPDGSALTFEVEVSATLRLETQAPELEFSLRSLVENAVYAVSSSSTNNGLIRVVARADMDRVIIAVEDNGPGMTDTALKQAAEPFYTEKQPGEGLGLGLFVVSTYVRSHAGELTFSRSLQGGCRVELSLRQAISPLSHSAKDSAEERVVPQSFTTEASV